MKKSKRIEQYKKLYREFEKNWEIMGEGTYKIIDKMDKLKEGMTHEEFEYINGWEIGFRYKNNRDVGKSGIYDGLEDK